MADIGTRFTDKRQQELEKRLRCIYSDAAKDIEAKMQDFNQRHKVKEAKYRQMLKDGKITQADFNDWMKGQVFQGNQWQAKKDQITETLYQSNQIAARMVRGETVGVFAHNANFMSYQLEHTAGVNFGFGIYDSATVTRLIKSQPNLLPKSRVKRSKDKQWNSRKLTEQVTQGIIQGESLDKIAKRMAQAVSAQDWKFMRTYAQTAMSGAQNGGRQLSLQNAYSMGIKVKKEWMATLDGHTRTEHRRLDGQKVNIYHPFQIDGYSIMYPGDPHAHPAMVYNCRCTLVGDLEDYPSEYERYDNIDGKPVKSMTYQEWYDAKKGLGASGVDAVQYERARKYIGDILGGAYGQAYSKEQLDNIDKLYSGMPEYLQKFYRKYGGELQPIMEEDTYRGESSGFGYFYPKDGHVHFLAREDAQGSLHQHPYELGAHEYGHNMDYLAADGKGWISNKYVSDDGRHFGQIIDDDWDDAVRKFSGLPARLTGDELHEAAYRRAIEKQEGPGGVGAETYAREMLLNWRQINGISRSDSEYLRIRQELDNVSDSRGAIDVYMRHRDIWGSIFQDDDIRFYQEEYKVTSGMVSKFCDYVKSEYSLKDRGCMSDMFEHYSVTHDGPDYPFGVGHGKDYATNWGVSDYGLERTEQEAFAEMTEMEIANPDGLRITKRYLPHAYEAFVDMIRRAT